MKSLCERGKPWELPLWNDKDWPPETMASNCLYTIFSSSQTDSCAVQRALALRRRVEGLPCEGLCTTRMGKDFSYMLVKELHPAEVNWLVDAGVLSWLLPRRVEGHGLGVLLEE